MATKKILVVFYSRTGTTRRVAEALAAELQADLEEIIPVGLRAGAFSILRSLIETLRRRPARIVPPHQDPSHYDLVAIGTPVWAGSMTPPVRSYLLAYGQNLPQVGFFCTLGHWGGGATFAQMQALAGKPPKAVAAFSAETFAAPRFATLLGAFATALLRQDQA